MVWSFIKSCISSFVITTFLSNLGDSLKAFLTYDIEEKVSGFWGLIQGSTKVETKADEDMEYAKSLFGDNLIIKEEQ